MEEANDHIRLLLSKIEDQDNQAASLKEGRKQVVEVSWKKPYFDCSMWKIMLKFKNKSI